MKYFFLSLLLISTQAETPDDGSRIPEPNLADYSKAQRQPGILGQIEEVQDMNGNPSF